MTLNDLARTLSQEKKCKVTLYDKVGDIVIIQCKKRKSSVVSRCRVTQCRVAIVISYKRKI